MPKDTIKHDKGKSLTPLWVISLFLSLTETITGIAVTQTSGGIQVALAAFVIAFPALIAAAFFSILWVKPYVLYAPIDYGKEVDVERFVGAIRGSERPGELYERINEVLEEHIGPDRIASDLYDVIKNSSPDDAEKRLKGYMRDVKSRISKEIHDVGFITIDTRPMVGKNGEIWQVPFDKYKSAADLLAVLWNYLDDQIGLPAYTYGQIWALRETHNRTNTVDISKSRLRQDTPEIEAVSLEAAGLRPGMNLEAFYIRRPKQIDRGAD